MSRDNPLKKWHVAFLALLVISFFFLRLWPDDPPTQIIMLKNQELNVYVAKTLEDMYRGLGGRSSLDDKDGMLFVYDFPGEHGIVMRDMQFAIDIVWLDRGTVVDIAPGVPAEPGVPEHALRLYRPRVASTLILELPAGWAAAHDLKIGDILTSEEDNA